MVAGCCLCTSLFALYVVFSFDALVFWGCCVLLVVDCCRFVLLVISI